MDDKSNAITASPRVREWLDWSGALVTIDALGCPKEIAVPIVTGGGDSLWAVQDHPPRRHEESDAGFTAAWETDCAGLEYGVTRTEEPNRGREEVRECPGIAHPKGLRDAGPWKGLAAIRMVPCRRVVEGVERIEFRDSIGGFVGTAEESPSAIRGHWGLENAPRWVLDVVFHEDDSRHHVGNSGENLALPRKLAISRLQPEKSSNASLKTKRLRRGWDDDYLAKVLAANNIEDA